MKHSFAVILQDGSLDWTPDDSTLSRALEYHRRASEALRSAPLAIIRREALALSGQSVAMFSVVRTDDTPLAAARKDAATWLALRQDGEALLIKADDFWAAVTRCERWAKSNSLLALLPMASINFAQRGSEQLPWLVSVMRQSPRKTGRTSARRWRSKKGAGKPGLNQLGGPA